MRQPGFFWMRAVVLAMGASVLAVSLPAQAQTREIVIAQVAPLTGAQGPSGKAIRAGVQIYFDSINAAGGINGAKIRFISKDDANLPADTVRLVKETLAAERPAAFIAVVGTPNLEALAKDGVLVNAGVSVVGGASGAFSMIGAPNIFITKATYHDEVERLFTILNSTGVTRVGIVYEDSTFGLDILTGADKASVRTGVQIVLKASYPRTTTDLAAAVDAVFKADPQLVYLGAVTTAGVEFVKQYRERGGTAQIYGMSVIDSSVMVSKLGAEMSRGFAFGVVVPPSNAKGFAVVREYQELATRFKNPELGARSMEGFISAKVLVHALRKAKNPTAPAVTQALASISQLDLGNYMIDFNDKGHTGSRFVDFAILDSKGRTIR
jgi:branched-chain amino acid transport system substrate-binding protein